MIKIAGVFLNQVRLRMKLQSDLAVIYRLGFNNSHLDRPLTKADLAHAFPYNIYAITGLPQALSVVQAGQPLKIFILLAYGTGGYAFASIVAEHNRNVVHWQGSSVSARSRYPWKPLIRQ